MYFHIDFNMGNIPKNSFSVLALILLSSFMQNKREVPLRIDPYPDFSSKYVKSRNIEVMLPPGYNENQSYDVIYMHDGQNVFNPETAYAGDAWEVDKAMRILIEENKIRPAIVVAIWNTPLRMNEYMPAQPAEESRRRAIAEGWEDELLSDNYLKFIVSELKPFIDSIYPTLQRRENTFIMGSSMGGLISIYALSEYPNVFGGAACISTHWPALDGVFLDYVKNNLPQPENHKVYFDHGTETQDVQYETFQQKVDEMIENKGFTRGKNWLTLKFDGADHSEKAWQERVHLPLMFFLGKK